MLQRTETVKHFGWTPDSEEGHTARVKAFNKLIEHYEHAETI